MTTHYPSIPFANPAQSYALNEVAVAVLDRVPHYHGLHVESVQGDMPMLKCDDMPGFELVADCHGGLDIWQSGQPVRLSGDYGPLSITEAARLILWKLWENQ